MNKLDQIISDFKRDGTPLKTLIRKLKLLVLKSRPEYWAVFPHIKGLTLNVGCGRDRFKGVIGIDDRSVSHYAGWDALPDVTASAYALPFEDETVDTVISMHMLEHLEDRERFFREAFRVLKPGGTLCLILPNYDHLGEGFYWSDPTHLHAMSPKENWEREDFTLFQQNRLGKFGYVWAFDVFYRKPTKDYLSHSYGVLAA